MVATHTVEKIEFKNEELVLHVDGVRISAPLDRLSQRLKTATEIERMMYRISPSGYGIHWPLIDEDLAIEQIMNEFSR